MGHVPERVPEMRREEGQDAMLGCQDPVEEPGPKSQQTPELQQAPEPQYVPEHVPEMPLEEGEEEMLGIQDGPARAKKPRQSPPQTLNQEGWWALPTGA